MNHNIAPVSIVIDIVEVRIANVKGKMVIGCGVELIKLDLVKTFRTLPVAFFHFGPWVSGKGAYGVGKKEFEICAFFNPQLKSAWQFENADEHLTAKGKSFGVEFLTQRALDGCKEVLSLAAGLNGQG